MGCATRPGPKAPQGHCSRLLNAGAQRELQPGQGAWTGFADLGLALADWWVDAMSPPRAAWWDLAVGQERGQCWSSSGWVQGPAPLPVLCPGSPGVFPEQLSELFLQVLTVPISVWEVCT